MTLHPDYLKFIKDKKVIFVGPATNIIGKNLGGFIDDFDVVIRTNGSIFLLKDEEFKKDYGSRCDVLYTNIQFMRDMHPLNKELFKNHNVQWIVSKIKSKAYAYYNDVCNFRSLDVSLIKDVHATVHIPLMGSIIMEEIILYQPSLFFVTGIDFYITKPSVFIPNDWREYVKGYIPEKIQNYANIHNRGKKEGHDLVSNTKFFYEKVKSGKIKTHDFIQESAEKILRSHGHI